jgi:uncharacterized RDD family membrane protein YckC
MTGLVSGEGVPIELNHAGLGSRTVAAALDLGIQFVTFVVVTIVTAQFIAGDSDAVAATVLLELVLILAGYPIIFEWLTRGRTLGKMAMGLRVLRDDGGPIGFRQALTRGLAGFLLEKPGIVLGGLGTGIGMITMGASARSKRVGDMMAGTFVLNERAGPSSALQPLQLWVPPELYGWAQALDLSGLNDQLALQLRQFVVRAAQMSPSAQMSLGEGYRAQVLAVIAPPPPPGVPTPVLLTTVLAERRRRSSIMMPPAPVYAVYAGTPSPRPPAPGGGVFTPPS